MTKAELIAQVAKEAQVKKVDAEKTVNALIKVISDTLKSQGRLSLAGFGTFVVAERKAREGRHPMTGSPIKIPVTRVVKFKAGKNLQLARLQGLPGNDTTDAPLPGNDTTDPP